MLRNVRTGIRNQREAESQRAQMAERVARGLPPVDVDEIIRIREREQRMLKTLAAVGLV